MPFGKVAKEEFTKDSSQSYIGEGTVVEGKITCEGNLRVDGKVKGEIEIKGILTVGEKGVIDSNVKAGEIVIMGAINGNVTAEKKIEIFNSGKVNGDVQTPRIAIEEGGILDGKCTMNLTKEVKEKYKGEIQK